MIQGIGATALVVAVFAALGTALQSGGHAHLAKVIWIICAIIATLAITVMISVQLILNDLRANMMVLIYTSGVIGLTMVTVIFATLNWWLLLVVAGCIAVMCLAAKIRR